MCLQAILSYYTDVCVGVCEVKSRIHDECVDVYRLPWNAASPKQPLTEMTPVSSWLLWKLVMVCLVAITWAGPNTHSLQID